MGKIVYSLVSKRKGLELYPKSLRSFKKWTVQKIERPMREGMGIEII